MMKQKSYFVDKNEMKIQCAQRMNTRKIGRRRGRISKMKLKWKKEQKLIILRGTI